MIDEAQTIGQNGTHTYLIDEAQTIGQNGTHNHNPNTVASLLHHFLATHGQGEKECDLHADNCAGQNKNKTIMAYLAWHAIVGLHEKISLHFMTAGHTRCLVDGCFGLLKKKYRRSDTFTLQQLCDVVDSAACNVAELVDPDKTPWYDWDTYLLQLFKPLKGISKLSHFVFDRATPGMVKVSSSLSGEQQVVQLLKPGVHPDTLVSAVLPAILPLEVSQTRGYSTCTSMFVSMWPQHSKMSFAQSLWLSPDFPLSNLTKQKHGQ